jgi:hypothetical protein
MQEETRKCVVKGKTNVDGLTKKKNKRIRKVAQSEEVGYTREIVLLNALLTSTADEYADKAISFLKAKINGYKQQI